MASTRVEPDSMLQLLDTALHVSHAVLFALRDVLLASRRLDFAATGSAGSVCVAWCLSSAQPFRGP